MRDNLTLLPPPLVFSDTVPRTLPMYILDIGGVATLCWSTAGVTLKLPVGDAIGRIIDAVDEVAEGAANAIAALAANDLSEDVTSGVSISFEAAGLDWQFEASFESEDEQTICVSLTAYGTDDDPDIDVETIFVQTDMSLADARQFVRLITAPKMKGAAA